MLTPVSWTTLLATPALDATTLRFSPGFQQALTGLCLPQLGDASFQISLPARFGSAKLHFKSGLLPGVQLPGQAG